MFAGVWLKRVLIPLWGFQLGFLVMLFALACLRLRIAGETSFDTWNYSTGEYEDTNVTGSAMFVSFSGFSIIIDVFEIVQYHRRQLSAKVFTALSCLMTVLWMIGLIIIWVTQTTSFTMSGWFAIGPFVTAVGQLIYASVIFHRQRTGKLTAKPCQEDIEMEPSEQQNNSPKSGTRANPFRDPSPTPSGAQQSVRSDPFRNL